MMTLIGKYDELLKERIITIKSPASSSDFRLHYLSKQSLQLLTYAEKLGANITIFRDIPTKYPTCVHLRYTEILNDQAIERLNGKCVGAEMRLSLYFLADKNDFDQRLKLFVEDIIKVQRNIKPEKVGKQLDKTRTYILNNEY